MRVRVEVRVKVRVKVRVRVREIEKMGESERHRVSVRA